MVDSVLGFIAEAVIAGRSCAATIESARSTRPAERGAAARWEKPVLDGAMNCRVLETEHRQLQSYKGGGHCIRGKWTPTVDRT